jgi:Xaa-Pro aminopeptidase
VHHKLYCDWLDPERCRAGVVGMRGTIPPSFGLMKKYAAEIAPLLRDAKGAEMPVGVDYAETAMFFALQEAGLNVVAGQQIMLDARENNIVAMANKMLYDLCSDDVEAINAISGERCSPHPHNFTDRIFRPGDQAFLDILQIYQGYRTCCYRTFNLGRATPVQKDAYKKARDWLDAANALIKPGVSTDVVARAWPAA